MRIGKKPHEADLSYTTVRTGLTNIFFGTHVREESEGREGRKREYPKKLLAAEGALEERIRRGKIIAASHTCREPLPCRHRPSVAPRQSRWSDRQSRMSKAGVNERE